MSEKAIELLKQFRRCWRNISGLEGSLITAEKIDQALAELKEPEPTAGRPTEFTKEARKYCNSVIDYARFVKDNASEETKEVITKKLYELLFEGFAIIDRLAGKLKAKDEAIERYDKMWRAEQKSAAKAWNENKRLKEELESKCDNCVHLPGAVP